MTEIRYLDPNHYQAASDLMMLSYKAFIAEDPSGDHSAFWEVASPEALAASCIKGNLHVVAFDAETLVGIAGMEGTRHLKILFVNGAYHGRGIARQLWTSAKMHCLEKDDSNAPFTVNSSDYAIAIYERMGFRQSAPRQSKNGITFTPLKMEV